MDMTVPSSTMYQPHQVPSDLASALIDRYCRYSTQNLQDVQRRLRSLRGGVILSVDRAEDFCSYNEALLSMGHLVLTIGLIQARNGYDLSFNSGDDYIVTIPWRGSGWASTGGMFVEYDSDDIMIVAPLCRVDKHWDGPGEVLSIHVPADRFDAAVAKLKLGPLPSAPIFRVNSRRLRSFLRMVDMICRDLRDSNGPSPFLHPPLSDQAEEMLLTLLLKEVNAEPGAKAQPAPGSPAVPYYVRRAEKFIAANAQQAIGIDEIAKAAGVSARTVQYGFRVFLDATPMQYLKRMRYHRARAILSLGCSTRRISDIAVEIGCSNVSQFSRDYRALFGETPSETMSAVRRLVA